MLHEIQTVEAHGIACAEYRYEPAVVEDEEREYPLVCGQCDHFTAGRCILTGKVRQSSSLACPKVFVVAPF